MHIVKSENAKHDSKEYYLTFCDGMVWKFQASEEYLQAWLDKFTHICNLSPCEQAAEADFKITLLAPSAADTIALHEMPLLYKSGNAFNCYGSTETGHLYVVIEKEDIENPSIAIINMWNLLKPIFRYYTQLGGSPIHAGCAAINGKGFLIAARGSTGKSTSIRRLPDYYEKLCDDTTLIVKNNGYTVHPMPTWSDHLTERWFSRFDVQYSVPLTGIFFLEQSSRDQVTPILPGEAAGRIFESSKQAWNTYWHRMDETAKKERKHQVFDNSIELAKRVPCYRLEATLHGSFWEEIKKYMS